MFFWKSIEGQMGQPICVSNHAINPALLQKRDLVIVGMLVFGIQLVAIVIVGSITFKSE